MSECRCGVDTLNQKLESKPFYFDVALCANKVNKERVNEAEDLSHFILHNINDQLKYILQNAQQISCYQGRIIFEQYHLAHKSSSVIMPSQLLFITKGQMNINIGEKDYICKSGDFFLNSVGMPVNIEFSSDNIYAIKFKLEPSLVQESMVYISSLEQQELLSSSTCINKMPISSAQLLCLWRLVDLYHNAMLKNMQDKDLVGINEMDEHLYSLLLKELYCYILNSKEGVSLRKIFTSTAQDAKIAKAMNYLQMNFREDIEIDALAKMVGMAVPTFYKHFKQFSTLSPLQYFKRLRLYEAKRLMQKYPITAYAASVQVGYASEQHFSRDYKKIFGRPPMQDIKDCREI